MYHQRVVTRWRHRCEGEGEASPPTAPGTALGFAGMQSPSQSRHPCLAQLPWLSAPLHTREGTHKHKQAHAWAANNAQQRVFGGRHGAWLPAQGRHGAELLDPLKG